MRRLAVHLHPRAERAVRRGHPWVFADGIRQQKQAGVAGDLAVVFDRDNSFLAIGLYDPQSPIRVRILHRGAPATIDRAWFADRVRAAAGIRQPLQGPETTAFRLIHGENDGLPGLVVDRYGDNVVIKLYTAAWLPHLDDVIAGIDSIADSGADCASSDDVGRVVLRLSRVVARGTADTAFRDGLVLRGAPLDEPVMFRENGLLFEADLLRGQKTGFFLDQRDNRARVEQHSAGCRVLNVFAYTGGFSVYAARGGAREVTSVDISAAALAAADRNFQHNASIPAVAAATHRTLAGDAFDLLRALHAQHELFDVVILDPPSFAKARSEVDRALVSYARVIRLGLDVLADGGLLVAASCSSRVTADAFRAVVEDTARRAGRRLNVLEQTGHPLDHPIGFPEGAYLKCIFAEVRTGSGG